MAVRKTATKLADGRDFFYFDDSEPYASGTQTRRLDDPRPLPDRFAPVDGHPVTGPVMRHDPLTGDWIPMAAHRMNRTFLPPADSNPLGPARPGAEYQDGEIPDTDYDVVVFENRFPSLMELPETRHLAPLPTPVDGERIFAEAPANGRCEVICFGPDVNTNLVSMGPSRMRTVIEAWADRTAELSAIPQIKQVFVFENHGEEIGVTLHHPHGQIYAYPFITPRTNAMLRQAALLNIDGVDAVSGLDGYDFKLSHGEDGSCGCGHGHGHGEDGSCGCVHGHDHGGGCGCGSAEDAAFADPGCDCGCDCDCAWGADSCDCGCHDQAPQPKDADSSYQQNPNPHNTAPANATSAPALDPTQTPALAPEEEPWDGNLDPLNLIAAVRDAEVRAGTRMIAENAEWVWYVPVAARWPLEYHLVPKRLVPDFAALDEAQKTALADLYLRMMIVANHFHRRVDGSYVDVNYISAWHQAPCSPEDGREILGLFNQFYSFLRAPGKMKYLAGSESGMATWINDTTPERIAARTREAAREALELGAFEGLEQPITWL